MFWDNVAGVYDVETLLIDKADTVVPHPHGERMDLYRKYTPLWKR